MSMKRITLRLARNPGHPEGDSRQGYVIIAPLTPDGHIDLKEWRDSRKDCIVQRFHPDPDLKADGLLTHRGSHWRFHYDEDSEGPDEGGYHLDEHSFRPGEYVTISDHGDTPLTYIVTEVTQP